MSFKSLTFPGFLLLILAIYWILPRRSYRNALLLFASYIFYSWWDYRFLTLILISSFVDYFCGLRLSSEKNPSRRKLLLAASLFCNLTILGFFKYFNFFAESLESLLLLGGFKPDWTTMHIILPVGISFYTFQTLSYTIDVYRGKCPVCRDPLTFFLFVAFFPQLVAGPIERARRLIPQLDAPRTFNTGKAEQGLRYILYGYFLKIVVSDNLAGIVDAAYSDPYAHSGWDLILATYGFAFQIYGDFAGYSYIAIGSAALFGINLCQNFRSPYFAMSIKEFWTRWHISLSTWFKDYVYIWAFRGSRVTPLKRVCNVIATFTLSGLWHGANWTFLFWGLLNGTFYFIRPVFRQRHPVCSFVNTLVTFNLICLGWIFFRAKDLETAFQICRMIFLNPFPQAALIGYSEALLLLNLCLLLVFEFIQRNREDVVTLERFPRFVRWGVCYLTALLVFFTGQFDRVSFIYFQF